MPCSRSFWWFGRGDHVQGLLDFEILEKINRDFFFNICITFTFCFQHALRLIAFKQIHKVLGMDPIPQNKANPKSQVNPRKRKATSGSDTTEVEGRHVTI